MRTCTTINVIQYLNVILNLIRKNGGPANETLCFVGPSFVLLQLMLDTSGLWRTRRDTRGLAFCSMPDTCLETACRSRNKRDCTGARAGRKILRT